MKEIKIWIYVVAVFLLLVTPFIRYRSIFVESGVVYGNYEEKIGQNICNVHYFVDGKEYVSQFGKEFIDNNPVKLIYSKKDPQNVIVFSVSFLYMRIYMTFPIFLFFVISVFYFSFKQTKKDFIDDYL